MAEEKLPPHDIEAEEAVIGSLLIDPEAILKVAVSLKPEDFFSETNQAIYQACFSLCLLYTSPSPRDRQRSRMPSSA